MNHDTRIGIGEHAGFAQNQDTFTLDIQVRLWQDRDRYFQSADTFRGVRVARLTGCQSGEVRRTVGFNHDTSLLVLTGDVISFLEDILNSFVRQVITVEENACNLFHVLEGQLFVR